MREAILEYVRTCLPEDRILLAEPMKKHTTFRVGGAAEYFLQIETEQELAKLLPYLNLIGMDFFLLGNGSNLLVGDKGYRGVVLQLGSSFGKITVEGNRLTAQAGALMSQAAQTAFRHGLTGLEFASGIPGSIGGGVVMNAGAYGGEMKQVAERVRVMDYDGNILELDNATMEFGYRTSSIKRRHFVVLEVTFLLQPQDPDKIAARMEELAEKRKEKQPLSYPSAGSTFKRPEGYFAGKLIMDAGLRGFTIGGARVSEKHCGFVINYANACAADIRELIVEVQERVREKFGVQLETEIIFLGDF